MTLFQNLEFKKAGLVIFILLIPLHIMFGIFYSQLFTDTDLIDNRLEVKDCTVSISSVIDETFTMKSKIKYVDKYIFPEISNIYCLGKIQNIIYDEEIEILVYRSPRLHFIIIIYVSIITLVTLFFNKDKRLDFLLLFYIFLYLLTIELFQYQSFFLPITFLIMLYPYNIIKSFILKVDLFDKPKILEKLITYRNIFLPFLILLIFIERYLWTDVSTWGLDQMTHIWVGSMYQLSEISVGNISSRYIPNPNGLVIVGKLLGYLPSLKSVSVVLTILQSFLLLLVHFSIPQNKRKDFSLFTIAVLSSIYMINSSVEFWGQYMILNINILFIYWLLSLVFHRKTNSFTFLAFLALMASSFYLNGIITGGIITIVGLLTINNYMDNPLRVFKREIFWIFLLLGVFGYFVWIPYFSEVSLNQILNFEQTYKQSKPSILWETIINFPIDFLFQWSEVDSYKASLLMFAEPNTILSIRSRYLQFTNLTLHALFGLSLLLQICMVLFNKNKNKNKNKSYDYIIKILFSTVVLSYLIFPLLGSYKIGDNQNPSTSIQYYPFFLMIIFTFPLIYEDSKLFKRLFIPITKYLFGIYVILNLLLSHNIYSDHINYDGDRITNADVPYSNKIQVIEFVADDWRSISESNLIPIYYDFDKVVFYSWITEFGYFIDEYYEAPFTLGREYDYEFYKRYGFLNDQEGLQERSSKDVRYIVSYYSLPPPDLENKTENHFKIGRLRVTILENSN